MSDGLVEHFVLLVPTTSPSVQLSNHRWLLLLQPTAQHLGKQVMVAIPVPLVIEGNQEQVAPLDMHQKRLAIGSPSDGIA
jgi:hypothetical protein